MNSICIFGDSIAKGVVFDAVKKKYSILKDSFANLLGREGAGVMNHARFGCTVTEGMKILLRHREAIGACDLTLLEFGGNDCDYNWEDVSRDPARNHDCKTPIAIFSERYEALIDTIRAHGGRPLLLTLPPVDEHRYFAWISKGLNADNIIGFLGTVRTIFTWQETYSGIVRALAEAKGVPLVDVRAAFLALRDYRKSLCEDGIHPNETGHRLIFELLKSKLLPLAAGP
ncbi:MAG: SGNH/GDSL hydrolase family protein [Clostridiales Family XIII bacterium]|jgi:lysophospholipase L1-like esterase|nr:SGNH/GDSL hydrolase family protein [Clostridiales Family XIII bacterium]